MSAFLAWKKAYESHTIWSASGFDYVPVEPIISFVLQKDLKVRVYCVVLDQNISKIGILQNKKLEETLDKIGINHGHLHNKNVCVRFTRDRNGDIDYSQIPRQYIIDFDQATI